jgi:hypothetical protein
MIRLIVMLALLATPAAAQRMAVVDINLIVGGNFARSGSGVTQSMWGDSSATVRFLQGKVWREVNLADTVSRLTERRLREYFGKTVSTVPVIVTLNDVRPTTANPRLGAAEMQRRKNRIGGLPSLTIDQAFADKSLRVDEAVVIDCRLQPEAQGDGKSKLTDNGARERVLVSLSILNVNKERKRVWSGDVNDVTNSRWKYYSKVMGLRQNDASLSGREILDLYQLALDRLLTRTKRPK